MHARRYRGSVDFSNIAFKHLGQPSTARPIFAISHNVGNNYIHSCTFADNSGPGLAINGASQAQITSSFVGGTDGVSFAVWNDAVHAVDFGAPSESEIVLTDNIAGDVLFQNVLENFRTVMLAN